MFIIGGEELVGDRARTRRRGEAAHVKATVTAVTLPRGDATLRLIVAMTITLPSGPRPGDVTDLMTVVRAAR
jgi:hypothetical protein